MQLVVGTTPLKTNSLKKNEDGGVYEDEAMVMIFVHSALSHTNYNVVHYKMRMLRISNYSRVREKHRGNWGETDRQTQGRGERGVEGKKYFILNSKLIYKKTDTLGLTSESPYTLPYPLLVFP